MRKTILIFLLALWPALAHAQSLTTTASALKGGPTLPATCKPATSGSRADVFVKTGSSAGVYYCSAANTWTLSSSGGSGGGTGTAYVTNTSSTYSRLSGTAFLDASAASGAQSINLGSSGASGDVSAVEVRKSDTSSNAVTVAFGPSTVRLTASGQIVKFIPGFSGWQVWSQDHGSQAPDGAVYFRTTTGPSVYARPSNGSYLDADVGGGALTITLGTSGSFPVEVRKSDTSSNAVTVDYTSSTIALSVPGAYIKLVPNGSGGWVVWSTDPTIGGYAGNGIYASNTSASYSPGSTVGYVDANAASGSQTVTLPSAATIPVEIRKSDTSANTVAINYGAGTYTLNATGRWVKFIPNGTAWVVWSGN